jgi:hypothetical protein
MEATVDNVVSIVVRLDLGREHEQARLDERSAGDVDAACSSDSKRSAPPLWG